MTKGSIPLPLRCGSKQALKENLGSCKSYIMTRTQIQLPDDLYRRAKAFAAEREVSLAEITRRGLEIFLARFPEPGSTKRNWKLPAVRSGGVKVPLEKLKNLVRDDEESRHPRQS